MSDLSHDRLAKGFVIAIDGPVASGKGTIAPLLAEKLGGFYLDTGIFYRCLALYCIENSIAFTNREAISSILPLVKVVLVGEKVLLNGKDVSDAIRSVAVSDGSSKVGAIDEVQEALVKMQRSVCQEKINNGTVVVIEGRSTGTATFPDASLKIYLTARLSVRAQRRFEQWRTKGIQSMSLAEIAEDVRERDTRDMTRKKHPLVSDPETYGYIIIDDSDMTKEKTLQVIIAELKKKNLYNYD